MRDILRVNDGSTWLRKNLRSVNILLLHTRLQFLALSIIGCVLRRKSTIRLAYFKQWRYYISVALLQCVVSRHMIAIIEMMIILEILLKDFNNQSDFDAQITFKNFDWIYTSDAILVLLKYAVKDASSCIQAVNIYMILNSESVSDWKSLLFNMINHSTFIVFSYEHW